MNCSEILKTLGMSEDTQICFEAPQKLYELGLIYAYELAELNVKSDFFDLSERVRKRTIATLIDEGVVFLTDDGIIISPLSKIPREARPYLHSVSST